MPKVVDARWWWRAVIAALAIAFVQGACAETRVLYKWTDANGKQQYSDRPPTGFKGEVTRIEFDLDAQPAAPPSPASKPSAIPPDVMRDVTAPDINKTRKDRRERLEAAVQKAREKVAQAQAALDAGGDPKDGERRMIQRTYSKAQPGKSNCRPVVDSAGQRSVMCPQAIPSDEYYERMRGLEEALRNAQDELADAEAAYRRGVD